MMTNPDKLRPMSQTLSFLADDELAELAWAPRGSLSFVVYGEAVPTGSKRAGFNRKTGRSFTIPDEGSKRRDAWRDQIQQVAGRIMARTLTGQMTGLLTGPLRLELHFYRARPRGHYGTGRNEGVLKPSAPAFPTTKPDVTKLTRAVEDALTGIVWRDDAQVVELTARKFYGTPERVEVMVETA